MRVRFLSATALVQFLQTAKLSLQLQSALLNLDKYDLLILDDLSVTVQGTDELGGFQPTFRRLTKD